MVRISTSEGVRVELHPKGERRQTLWRARKNIPAGGKAGVYSVQYLVPGISKNSSIVVDAVFSPAVYNLWWKTIEMTAPQKSHFYFNLLCQYFCLFRIVNFFFNYHVLTRPLWGLVRTAVQSSQGIVRAQNALHVLLTLLSISTLQASLRHLIPLRVFLDTNYFHLL